jgi:hypothetical protein
MIQASSVLMTAIEEISFSVSRTKLPLRGTRLMKIPQTSKGSSTPAALWMASSICVRLPPVRLTCALKSQKLASNSVSDCPKNQPARACPSSCRKAYRKNTKTLTNNTNRILLRTDVKFLFVFIGIMPLRSEKICLYPSWFYSMGFKKKTPPPPGESLLSIWTGSCYLSTL